MVAPFDIIGVHSK